MDNSASEAARQVKTKPFLIGKELKTKDLLHTAADRASGSTPGQAFKDDGDTSVLWRGLGADVAPRHSCTVNPQLSIPAHVAHHETQVGVLGSGDGDRCQE